MENTVELEKYGLTSLQSRVYVALLKLGPIRAPRLGSAIGIARPEVYRVLRELSGKGLVQKTVGSPYTFRPVSAGRAIDILLERYSQRMNELQTNKTKLVDSLSTFETPREFNSDEGFTIITGGGNLVARANQMITNAKSDYAGVMSRYGLKRILINGVARRLVEAKKRRRLHIRIISEVDETNVKTANYLSRHFEIRLANDLEYCLDIVDKKSLVLGPMVTDEELTERNMREVDLYTSNTRFVRGMYSMFEQLWRASPRYVYGRMFPSEERKRSTENT